jgi:hypothetical protein
MKTKLLVSILVLACIPSWLIEASSVKDLDYLPKQATSNDFIQVKFQYNFTSQPCTRDSFTVSVINNRIQFNVYYRVGFALSPISGYDSLTINRLQPGDYTLVVKTIDLANQYSDSASTSLNIKQGYALAGLTDVNQDLCITPTNNKIFYTHVEAASTIRIFDLNGSMVQTFVLNSGDGSIDVSNIKNGIYFVRFEQGEKTVTKKWIVRK